MVLYYFQSNYFQFLFNILVATAFLAGFTLLTLFFNILLLCFRLQHCVPSPFVIYIYIYIYDDDDDDDDAEIVSKRVLPNGLIQAHPSSCKVDNKIEESSQDSHRCGASNEISDDKINE